ncbi:hypothetical protein ACLOJK_035165 [Asimina triloba]
MSDGDTDYEDNRMYEVGITCRIRGYGMRVDIRQLCRMGDLRFTEGTLCALYGRVQGPDFDWDVKGI